MSMVKYMLGKLGLLIDPYEFPDVDRRMCRGRQETLAAASKNVYLCYHSSM